MSSKMAFCGPEQGIGGYVQEIQQKISLHVTIFIVADHTLNHFVNTILIYDCPS
jgi:hypothetical protein